MACAHAKFTGEVGVCLATSGPGRDPSAERAVRREARPPAGGGDRRPAGAHRRSAASYQQEVDLVSLFKDVAARVRPHGDVTRRRSASWSTARCASRSAERTVTCLIVPNDVQELDAVESPPREHGTVHTGIGYQRAAGRARARATCERAAERAQRRREGGDAGRRRARSARTRRGRCEVAELLGAGVAKALLGKAALPDDLPYVHRLDRPARHEAELGPDEGLRHAAHGRLALPLLGVPAGARARRAACRSTSTRGCSASATRWRSTSSATARETLRALLPLLRAQGRPRRGASEIEGERRASGGS